jgi:hypothetical protein
MGIGKEPPVLALRSQRTSELAIQVRVTSKLVASWPGVILDGGTKMAFEAIELRRDVDHVGIGARLPDTDLAADVTMLIALAGNARRYAAGRGGGPPW